VRVPVVVDVAREDDLLLAGLAGDRAGPGVVAARSAVGVAVLVIAELAEHPGAEHGAEAGLAEVDLSVRVLGKICVYLFLQFADLGAEHGQDRDLHAHRDGMTASASALSPATCRSWWRSVRTMSASTCASAVSLLAPDTLRRSR
jgi:hypothetical protein